MIPGSQTPKSQTTVWATNVGWISLFALLGVFLRYGRFHLRFEAQDNTVPMVAKVFRSLFILKSRPLAFEFTHHGERVDDPDSPVFRVQAEINKFTDSLFKRHSRVIQHFNYPDPRIRADRVFTNLIKTAAQTTYDLLIRVEFARYRQQLGDCPSGRLIIMSRYAVLCPGMPANWAGEEVKFVSQWSLRNSLTLHLIRSIFAVGKGILSGPQRRPIEGKPAVAMATAWGLDRTARTNDLYWWWDSEIPAEQVILCFEYPHLPADTKIVEQAKNLGMRCVVLNAKSIGDSPHLFFRPAPGPGLSLIRFFQHARLYVWGILHGRFGAWVATRSMDMIHHSSIYEDFQREMNVRAFIHYQDSDLDYVSLACDTVNSARIGHHWSNQHWPVAYQARLSHVYFSWGRHYASVMEAANSCVDHVLLGGCIVNNGSSIRQASDRLGAVAAGESVRSNGASRVLTLFDTSLPCGDFYRYFIQKVLDDRRIGILIKPKDDTSIPWNHEHVPELKSLFDRAESTGRAAILDWAVTPGEAAAQADITIGVDINSAVIMAHLSGQRAVHLDYARLQDSPLSKWAKFYEAGPDRLVFSSPDLLWAAIERFFNGSEDNSTIGIPDPDLMKEIDEFNDSKAGERMGGYINSYLSRLELGLDREQALQQADVGYADKWGTHTVLRGLPSTDEKLVQQPNREAIRVAANSKGG